MWIHKRVHNGASCGHDYSLGARCVICCYTDRARPNLAGPPIFPGILGRALLTGRGRTVLDAAGPQFLAFFNTHEARALRLVDKEFKSAVAVFPWSDITTRIAGDLRLRRACFPMAQGANLSRRGDLDDAALRT